MKLKTITYCGKVSISIIFMYKYGWILFCNNELNIDNYKPPAFYQFVGFIICEVHRESLSFK